MIPYANIEIDFTVEHLVMIATNALEQLKELMDKDEFEEFLVDNEVTGYHRKFLLEEEINKCPHCKGELEQETYYDDVSEDTSYYNFCSECGWNDYPA